jgi:hypothetical protein
LDRGKALLQRQIMHWLKPAAAVLIAAIPIVIVAGCERIGYALHGASTTLSVPERAACTRDGGTVGRFGISQAQICDKATSDGGKACSKSTDCESICDAETRTCSANSVHFGCYSFLDENGAEVSICAD